MKRCPTCKREFEDLITYCQDDGTPLVSEPSEISNLKSEISGEISNLNSELSSGPDSDATLVSPSPRDRDIPATQYGQLGGKATVSGSVADLPMMPNYGAPAEKRRVWPWVVAGLAILFLFGIVIAAVIAIPKIVSRPKPVVATESPSNEQGRTRTPSQSTSANGAPTDKNTVLSQLTDIEKQWTVANIEGDKDTLDQILADDYRGSNPPHNKQQYLDGLRPDPTMKSWEFQDLRLDLDGDRATLSGYLRQETTRGVEVYGFTDEFVWRDARWQATGSRTTRVK